MTKNNSYNACYTYNTKLHCVSEPNEYKSLKVNQSRPLLCIRGLVDERTIWSSLAHGCTISQGVSNPFHMIIEFSYPNFNGTIHIGNVNYKYWGVPYLP
jgi:hypothetical protein